ncbi:MAG TPA: TPM domain-containing protein [Candidatus Binatia bacterium]
MAADTKTPPFIRRSPITSGMGSTRTARSGYLRTLLWTSIIGLVFPLGLFARDFPPLKPTLNDFGRMFPPASFEDLEARLARFKTQTGYTIAVLTLKNLEGDDIAEVGRAAFQALRVTDAERQRSVLLLIAREERKIDLEAGTDLEKFFPKPVTIEKLEAQVDPYFNGLRSDLGVHAAAHYMMEVITGEFRADRITEAEALENESKRGAGAGAIFAVCLSPFLAFFVAMLWGIYATQFAVQRTVRLFLGGIFGGGTARLVASLMELLGRYSDNLWYFILTLSILAGIFGSLTEFWMSGEWSGIPRIKDKVKRKPEDNMGI